MSLSQDIKEFGLDLGFSRVGITTADGFPEHVAELKARSEMYSYHISGRRDPLANAFPARLMPSAKAIVSLVYDFAGRAFPDTLVGKIGRVYQARCYLAPPERINGARLSLMRQFLEGNGCHVRSDISLPERRCAARAGIVTYGSNTFAFADGIGSFIVLYSFVVDMELDVDEPTLEVRCPPGCTLCVDNCPTGALYEPLKLDPRRCIAFNTFATQDGGAPGVTSDIPHEIRVKMGSWIHGCDVCQEVCPRNKDKLEARLPEDAFLVGVAEELDLSRLLNLDDEFYEKRVRPLMYNYIREKKYFQRNAAIALGNTGNPAYVPDLIRALDDCEGLVRGYAAWALGQIGGTRSREALERARSRESDGFAKKEIDAALAVT